MVVEGGSGRVGWGSGSSRTSPGQKGGDLLVRDALLVSEPHGLTQVDAQQVLAQEAVVPAQHSEGKGRARAVVAGGEAGVQAPRATRHLEGMAPTGRGETGDGAGVHQVQSLHCTRAKHKPEPEAKRATHKSREHMDTQYYQHD